MKHLEMLGLAAIAALGLMAFVGAGTASATTLFTDAAHTIPYPGGTTIHMTLKSGTTTSFTKTNGEAISTCTGSTIHGFTSNETGSTVSSSIGTLAWTGCNHTTTSIENEDGGFGTLEIASNGRVTGNRSNVTQLIFGVSCTYGTGEGTALGTLTTGETSELAINTVVPKTAGSFLCPGSTVMAGTWVVTSPHTLYVGS
jgi:hypothetical protein